MARYGRIKRARKYSYYCISDAKYYSAIYGRRKLDEFIDKQYPDLDSARKSALARSNKIFDRNRTSGDNESPLIHVYYNHREIGTVITAKVRTIEGCSVRYQGVWREAGVNRDIPLTRDGFTA